jgi:hypothetical protein
LNGVRRKPGRIGNNTEGIGQREPPPDDHPLLGPTQHLPGTRGKIAVMTARYLAGYAIYHPDDAKRDMGIIPGTIPGEE